jgi:hypothetical protein
MIRGQISIGAIGRMRRQTGESQMKIAERMAEGEIDTPMMGSGESTITPISAGELIIAQINAGESMTTPMMGVRDQVPLLFNLLCPFQIPPGLMGWP